MNWLGINQNDQMKTEFTDRWPKWFTYQSAPSCGWTALLLKLCEDLESVVGEDFRVLQVKEKFGGLRFYVGGATEAAHKLIAEAEAQSYLVCEVCGAPGKMRGGHWYKTLCDEHEKARQTA